jgi:hypothetical protein
MALVKATYINAVTVDADGTDPNVTNLNTLMGRAQTALTNNQAFLAIASPTTAQVATQAKALTRQVDAIIRLLLQQFDSLADS